MENKLLNSFDLLDMSLNYKQIGSFAIVLGSPSTIAKEFMVNFEKWCNDYGLIPIFCGIGTEDRDFFVTRNYQILKLGDEAIIDLISMNLKGKQWSSCRSALNRASRMGLAFQWVKSSDRNKIMDEVSKISDEWLHKRTLPELGFLMGTFKDLTSSDLLAISRDAYGNICGFVTWYSIPGAQGWMLDLMRSRSNVMNGLNDFLLIKSLMFFQKSGCLIASLGGVPLSNWNSETDGVTRWFMDILFDYCNLVYPFKKLWNFKKKFNPQWQPLYLAIGSSGSKILPLLAVIRACILSKAR
jgi:lysylphosphatidylglycerol synthetase-like protein (DUF2156 family)